MHNSTKTLIVTEDDGSKWVQFEDFQKLQAELVQVKGELVVANAGWDASQNSIKYHIAENERLKKAELRASKGVVYLAGLLSVKTKEKLSVDWIQEALNLED